MTAQFSFEASFSFDALFWVFIAFGYLELLHLETILQLRTFRSGQMCVFASGTAQAVLLVCAGFTRNSLFHSLFHPFLLFKFICLQSQINLLILVSNRVTLLWPPREEGSKGGSWWNDQSWRALGELLLAKPYSTVISALLCVSSLTHALPAECSSMGGSCKWEWLRL